MFQRLPQRNADVVDVSQQCLRLGGRQVRVVPASGSPTSGRRARRGLERRPGRLSRVRLYSYLRRGTRTSPAHPIMQLHSPAPVHIVARRPGRRHGCGRSAWCRRRAVRAAGGDGRMPRRLPTRRSHRCDRVRRRRSAVVRSYSTTAASADCLLPRLGPRIDRQRRR